MGRLERFKLRIQPLRQNPRKIFVYLPNGYDEHPERTYPVLYMFDGHNIFDDSIATFGKSWGMKQFLDESNAQIVVVGQDCNHSENSRLIEYNPFQADEGTFLAALPHTGDITAAWFVNKLKPACEKRYRIHSQREYVGIAGSSMGGLMSLYCISHYNDVFSKAACISSTMDICMEPILQEIQNAHMHENTSIYLDFGSKEVKSKYTFAKCMDNLLTINHEFQKHHCNTFPNCVVGGDHSEASWESIVPVFMEYLYPNIF